MPRLLAVDPFTKTLENELSTFLGMECSLVFPSTTHAAIDILPVIAGSNGALFVDEWTYATLWEGIHAAARNGARIFRFPHNNLSGLAQKFTSTHVAGDRVVLCDGVYPEGGGLAPAREMVSLVEKFAGWLCIDDSHGLAVLGRPSIDSRHPYGQGGGGIAKYLDLPMSRVLVMGTLSKALGIPLAFVAGSKRLLSKIEALSSSFVHSSSPSLPELAAAITALRISEREGDGLRQRLGGLVQRFQSALRQDGIPVADGLFPIQTLPFGRVSSAIQVGNQLRRQGIWPALQFSPPDHPDKGVLRFFITALHTPVEIDFAARAIGKVSRALNLLSL